MLQARTFVDFGQASPGQHVGPGWWWGPDGGLWGRGVWCNSGVGGGSARILNKVGC